METTPLFPVKDPQSIAFLPHKCQILLFHSGVMSAVLETGSAAEASGRLLILASSASLLFISSPHVLPNVIFPLLQRLNEEDKSNESQEEKLLSGDEETKGIFCCSFQQRQEV